ncbi:polysaccharide biosynthesis tyrosine autokinase [Flavobacterium sp. KS-LB2]|uniref:GumC family protein n=1 Tax=Flavobacterium sp. KS-LB2 TaxID=3120525 RepID=UPI0030D5F943
MDNTFEEQLDLKKELFNYLSYWKYFVICLALGLFSAYFYLRYISPVYAIEAKIKILEESNKGLKLPSELLGMMASKSGINLENELETMKSRRLIGPVVSQLNLTTSYFTKGKFKNTELWNAPLTVTPIITQDDSFNPITISFTKQKDGYLVHKEDSTTVFISGNHGNIKIKSLELLIEPNANAKPETKEFFVRVVPFKAAVESLKNRISIAKVGDESDILSVGMQDVNTERGIAILDKLVSVFNEDGIYDRRMVNKKTVDFIDERFKNLTSELDSIEISKRDFKKSKGISFIEADAAVDVNKRAGADESLFRIETQIQLSKLLQDALTASKIAILPANIGLDNAIINNLINEYNMLVFQREKLNKTSGSENPTLKVLESQISGIKDNINASIYTYNKQLKVSLSQQQVDYSKASDMVLEIPGNEKMLRSIDREQKIKENLYLLLLQKREESAIAFAVTAPSIKIIEYATAGSSPVAPKRNIIFLVALFLGLAIPFSIIYIYNLLDTKIKDSNDVVFRKSQIPVIAEMPLFKDFKLFKDGNDRSVHAESFRILSSNASFSLPLKEKNVGQVILVTSSIMGEGKTFIATNLSLAYASYDKKVLLIGADMRKPKLDVALDIVKVDRGLSLYLHDIQTSWQDVVVKNNPYNDNLDVIFSGIIPPNPSSIISNGRFDALINEAKQVYDYIIIDTAPTIYVNDTFLIADNVDLTLYLTREDYTEKQLIDYVTTLKEAGKLKNMAFIFNGIKEKSGYGYGYKYSYNYGYGYGYGESNEQDSRPIFIKNPVRFIKSYFNKGNIS